MSEGAFFWENPKRKNRIKNPKYPQSRRILHIKSKSGYLRFSTSALNFSERI